LCCPFLLCWWFFFCFIFAFLSLIIKRSYFYSVCHHSTCNIILFKNLFFIIQLVVIHITVRTFNPNIFFKRNQTTNTQNAGLWNCKKLFLYNKKQFDANLRSKGLITAGHQRKTIRVYTYFFIFLYLKRI